MDPKGLLKSSADRLLATPAHERASRVAELGIEDPEILLEVAKQLRLQLDVDPVVVRGEAEYLFGFLSSPKRPIGLFDEREYFLGEFALLGGTACRLLAFRQEARQWFDRAEGNLRLTVNAVADWSRVSYQRLALLLEERNFDALFEQLPALIQAFESLEMREEALKCRLLEGLGQMETGDLLSAERTFRSLVASAKEIRSDTLVALAYTNLLKALGALGQASEALRCSEEAVHVFEKLGNRFGLAKAQKGLGILLRGQMQREAAIAAFRDASASYLHLGRTADVAAVGLVIADLLLELGRGEEARQEVVAALPIIDQHQMVPEGMAALSLLKASLRENNVDHKALRDLHGFFEEAVS
ncbi:MAG: hypothetical protein ACRD1B_00055 [Thermoanaerobaculia bacterium]